MLETLDYTIRIGSTPIFLYWLECCVENEKLLDPISNFLFSTVQAL